MTQVGRKAVRQETIALIIWPHASSKCSSTQERLTDSKNKMLKKPPRVESIMKINKLVYGMVKWVHQEQKLESFLNYRNLACTPI